MPKIKTRKAAAKKFKKTASGKLLRGQANKSHNTAKRSQKRMRQLRGTTLTSETQAKQIKKMLPSL